MAGSAAGDRPVPGEARRGIAVAAEAEVVKACFDADLKVRAGAAMTGDTRALAAAIDVVVMALNAGHGAMLVVGKVQR